LSIAVASDPHADGSPVEGQRYHRFHRVKGGFVSVAAGARFVRVWHYDVRGTVDNEHEFTAE
jgi:hypothetical protein